MTMETHVGQREDDEIAAIKIIHDEMLRLRPDQRGRVMAYLVSRLDIPIPPDLKTVVATITRELRQPS